MKTLVILLCLCSLTCLQSCFIFDSYSVYYRYASPHIDSVAVPTLNLSHYEKKYPTANAVYLGVDAYIEPILDGGKYECQGIYMQRYLVLNPDDDDFSTFTIEVGKEEELNAADIIVISPDGKKKQYTKDVFVLERTHKYLRRYKFALPGISKGSIVDAAYNIFSASGDYYSRYRPMLCRLSEPCEYLRYTVVDRSKLGTSVNMIGWDNPAVLSYRTLPNGAQAYIYERYDLPALEGESWAPMGQTADNEIEVDYYDKSLKNEMYWGLVPFSMNMVTFEKPSYNTSESEKQLLATFTQDAIGDTQEDYRKIVKIADHCRKKLRLRYEKPEAISFTKLLQKGVGTPLQVAECIKRMCDYTGIQAQTILVHNAHSKDVNMQHRDYVQFSTPGVLCTVGFDRYLVFPEHLEFSPSVIPAQFLGERAMVIDIGNDELKNYSQSKPPPFPQIITLPDTSLRPDENKLVMKISIEKDGSLIIEETQTVDGESAAHAREALSNITALQRSSYLRSLQTYSEFAETLEQPLVQKYDDPDKPVSFRFRYKVPGYVAFHGKTGVLNTRLLFDNLIGYWKKKDTLRTSEIRIYDNNRTTRDISIQLPPEWTFKKIPRSYKTATVIGTAETLCSGGGNSLRAIFTRWMPNGLYPKTEIGELQTLLSHRLIFEDPMLIFTIN